MAWLPGMVHNGGATTVARRSRRKTTIPALWETGPVEYPAQDPEFPRRLRRRKLQLSFAPLHDHTVGMTSYLYELPTTGAISFADVCVDSTATYTADIADATEARANLRAVLKESKRTDEKDHLRLVKVCRSSL